MGVQGAQLDTCRYFWVSLKCSPLNTGPVSFQCRCQYLEAPRGARRRSELGIKFVDYEATSDQELHRVNRNNPKLLIINQRSTLGVLVQPRFRVLQDVCVGQTRFTTVVAPGLGC